uniref:Cyclin_C domain-containing protein n=1 Tax=Globodera pallida TaxID=36090 RepID=A0A183C390_GLOPA
MAAPPPMLLPEELLATAERMLFTKPPMSINHIVDLTRRNAFTDFMGLNALARNVFIAQFVHMKEIVFEQRKPITLFKDQGKAWERSDRFYGPYLVTKEFVRTLLDSGVLLLSSLSVVGSVFSNEADINAQPSFARSPVQSFCKLFLNQDLSDEDATKMLHFALQTLNIRCANDLFVNKFSEVLSLNANEQQQQQQQQLLANGIVQRAQQRQRQDVQQPTADGTAANGQAVDEDNVEEAAEEEKEAGLEDGRWTASADGGGGLDDE